MSSFSKSPFSLIFAAALLISLLTVIVFQQVRIGKLEKRESSALSAPARSAVSSSPADSATVVDFPPPRTSRRTEDPLNQARKERAASLEKQLNEIAAPLAEDMASTMFKAEVKPGQSIITGGYKTPDGKSQFTILKPQLIHDESGHDYIRIESKIIDMGAEDIAATGLDSLATNAKNTLQHAETWEESDVSNTMETLQKSSLSDLMSGATMMTAPGSEFTMSIGTNETGSYVLKGTATPSPDGSGVVLQTRIEQRDPATGQ